MATSAPRPTQRRASGRSRAVRARPREGSLPARSQSPFASTLARHGFRHGHSGHGHRRPARRRRGARRGGAPRRGDLHRRHVRRVLSRRRACSTVGWSSTRRSPCGPSRSARSPITTAPAAWSSCKHPDVRAGGAGPRRPRHRGRRPCAACGIDGSRWPSFVAALESLLSSEVLREPAPRWLSSSRAGSTPRSA